MRAVLVRTDSCDKIYDSAIFHHKDGCLEIYDHPENPPIAVYKTWEYVRYI